MQLNQNETQAVRVRHADLLNFASTSLRQAGAADDIADGMAKSLVYGDLFGFRTHGLRRLPYNIKQIQQGKARGDGAVNIVQDRLATAHWDANGLSGLYVVPLAVEQAVQKAKQCGTATLVVKRCDHVASLAAYLHLATSQGMVISMMASTPAQASVAPFGAKSRVFSPNPFGFAVPYRQQSIMFDLSFSVTAAGKVRQAYDRHEKLPWPAIVSHSGEVTNDPREYIDHGGALLPLGGADLGFKGYGLCLMSELLTMGLSGYGREQGGADGEFNSVYIQVTDPLAFTSEQTFQNVVADLARRCQDATPVDSKQPPRLPGDRAWHDYHEQMQHGVLLDELTWPRLVHVAKKLGVELPLFAAV